MQNILIKAKKANKKLLGRYSLVIYPIILP